MASHGLAELVNEISLRYIFLLVQKWVNNSTKRALEESAIIPWLVGY